MAQTVQYDAILQTAYRHVKDRRMPQGTLLSFPLPTVYNGRLTDLFFTFVQDVSGTDSTVSVTEVFLVDPQEDSVAAAFTWQHESTVHDFDVNAKTYGEYMRLKKRYAEVYETIRPFVFETVSDKMQRDAVSEFVTVFFSVFDRQMQELYLTLGEAFFGWATAVLKSPRG